MYAPNIHRLFIHHFNRASAAKTDNIFFIVAFPALWLLAATDFRKLSSANRAYILSVISDSKTFKVVGIFAAPSATPA